MRVRTILPVLLMATRIFFPSSGSAAVSPTINAGGEWEHSSGTRLPCSKTAGVTALSTTAYTPDAADHGVDGDALNRQFVMTEQLGPQTIAAQAVKWQFQALEAHQNNNQFLALKIFVVSGDGGTIKETLLAIQRDGTEIPTALTNRGDSATTTEATVEDGDRLVCEIGIGGTPGGGGGVQGHNGSIRFGESAAGGDLPEDDAATGTTFRPWLEFANTLSFQGDAQTLTAGTPTATVTAPAATLVATRTLAAGTPVVTFSAPTATLVEGGEAQTLSAGTPVVTVTAPTATLQATRTLAAGTPTVTLSAPTATLVDEGGAQTLVAGTPTVTVTAPTAILQATRTLAAGTPQITVTAPTASLLPGGVVLVAGTPTVTFTAPTATLESDGDDDDDRPLGGCSGLSGPYMAPQPSVTWWNGFP